MNFDNRPYDLEKAPSYQKKQDYWETSFGLQATDNLRPSDYLISLSKDNIEGTKSYQEIIEDLTVYYSENQSINRTMEADFASVRITEILASESFTLSPATLISYHERLFKGIEEFRYPVGKVRQENISKTEEVLGGLSVMYSDFREINTTLSYDFTQEKAKDYSELSDLEIVKEVTKFISGVWQIHPFREGNTRTTAVFTIKYLRSLGFEIDNEPFKKHAKYFRDALVLDNAPARISNKTFLNQFMENVLLSGKNELSSKQMLLKQLDKLSPQDVMSSFENYSTEKLTQILKLPKALRENLIKEVGEKQTPNAFEQRLAQAQKERQEHKKQSSSVQETPEHTKGRSL
ncbi:hypothetical protein RyT2_29940 [Pseudolactococcus yaeyamensis]